MRKIFPVQDVLCKEGAVLPDENKWGMGLQFAEFSLPSRHGKVVLFIGKKHSANSLVGRYCM
ncbi:MAG TPA: hypothetical protein IAA13_04750 [Candidatus Alistipes merdigallinarum]|nr:hypothetical protein [Candidatus Alistipes merdigallinarum]